MAAKQEKIGVVVSDKMQKGVVVAVEWQVVPMRMRGALDGTVTYEAELGSINSGAVTYGVRVRPQYPELSIPFAIPLVKWA